jgi:GDP-L-fucose synthase
MELSSKIYIAGHRGMVGSAIWRELHAQGYRNLLGRTRNELNLLSQVDVLRFFSEYEPEYVFLAAAKVGGIHANNTEPAPFLFENLQIQNNVIHSAWEMGVKKLLFLGSSCIYPKHAPQPLKEEYLLTGPLEPTNEPYAIAKIAGLKMCEAYRRQYGADFISVMPANLYGPNDNYDLNNSHVLPALIRKFHEAATQNHPHVTCWGTGSPKREFMYVDDLASACVFLMKNYSGEGFLNVGTGVDVTICDAVKLVRDTIGYKGDVRWDTAKPDGTPRKLLDVSKLSGLGWTAQTDLATGLRLAYQSFLRDERRS